ncbi:MAG TPA: MATE family efflux transporter [Candidatus Avimonoglobus intestinipullorum]|uniref:Multidrug export protein MepA n=1 Tax=Candidatus Avimonoglobus intestinipullorum TaxID=2840699 RepID=A0A9D1LVW9_9FIRM|nr:MATE family efflux transporter [Candidatus Avimonoglobus intestinipullorum]
MADNNTLGTEKIGKLLLNLALPAITAQIINLLYNLVDRIYIGHIPEIGSAALTGVGVTFPIIMIVSAFSSLVGMGGAPQASIMMGRKDHRGALKVVGNCVSFLTIIAVLLTAAILIFKRDLLMLFGASENTIGYAEDYLTIYALGTIFVQYALGLNMFITCQGFAKTSMLTVLIGAVLNIILDPIFIFGFGMGVQGAALATILSQAVSAVWVVKFLCGKKTTLKIKRENLRLQKEIILPVLALGVSPFIMQSTESLLFVCLNSSLQRYGGDIAVGAMTILSSVMQLATLPLQGLTQGAQPIVSYNFGAQKLDRVKKAFQLLLLSAMAFSTAIWLGVMLLPRAFAGLFTNDTALIDYTAGSLRVYFAAGLVMGAQMACQQTFIALGNAKSSVFLALLRKVILLIPLIYILPLFLEDQVFAVFLAEPIADTLAAATTVTMFTVSFKKLMKNQKAADAATT